MLQQAAYFGVKAKKFGAQLIKADMLQDKVINYRRRSARVFF